MADQNGNSQVYHFRFEFCREALFQVQEACLGLDIWNLHKSLNCAWIFKRQLFNRLAGAHTLRNSRLS